MQYDVPVPSKLYEIEILNGYELKAMGDPQMNADELNHRNMLAYNKNAPACVQYCWYC